MLKNKNKFLMPDFVHQYLTPKSFIGEEDASVEWEHPEKPITSFLHTESYKYFKDDSSLYLFGRRGTGKTAIIRMFDYEIKSGYIGNYKYSWVIDQEDTYHDLAIQLRGSPIAELPQSEIVHFLIKKWTWVINASAMIAIYRKYEHKCPPTHKESIVILKDYLFTRNLIDDSDSEGHPVQSITNMITEALADINYLPIKLGYAIAKITNKLRDPGTKKAEKALRDVLAYEKTNCVVLIDSIEAYNLRDSISQAVITSLIEAIRLTYTNRHKARIIAKAAFPSEIYPYLSSTNQEKVEGKNLFILWRYKDLVCMLAKRHYLAFDKDKDKDYLLKLNDFLEAKTYMYKNIKGEIITDQGLKFDTLAYIIRHTQKKPRQVILLFNIMLTLAEKDGIKLNEIPVEFIKKGVHARLDILVKGNLDMYEQIYPNAEKLVMQILNRAKNYFPYSEIDVLMKEVSSLRTESSLSGEDVKRLLLETGSIGVEVGIHEIANSDKRFIEALFEYQVKGILTINNKSNLAIHPMLLQEIQSEIDMDCFVYPMPYENEEKALLNSMGIKLV